MWNLMNKPNKQNRDRVIDREQVDSSGVGGLGVLSKKKKWLMDMDNNVVIEGGSRRRYKGDKW